jgi:fatty-acid peroxygenase
VILDLYGTNHDPRSWEEPGTFRPDRFRDWNGSPFNLIPQGAGDFQNGHRCPGEWITIELLKSAVRLLTTEVSYDVPEQDLSIDLTRMPAEPKSRFVIRNVRPATPNLIRHRRIEPGNAVFGQNGVDGLAIADQRAIDFAPQVGILAAHAH